MHLYVEFRPIIRAVCLISGFVVSPYAFSQEDTPPTPRNESSYVTQRRIDATLNEIERLDNEIARLNMLLTEVLNAEKTVNDTQVDPSLINDELSNLNESVQELASLPADANFTLVSDALSKFQVSFSRFQSKMFDIGNPIELSFTSIYTSPRMRSGSTDPLDSELQQIIQRAQNSRIERYDSLPAMMALINLENFAFEFEESTSRSQLDAKLKSVVDTIASLDSAAVGKDLQLQLDQLRSYFVAMKEGLQSAITSRTTQITKLTDATLPELEKRLKEVEERQVTIDARLITAVYWMISALVLMFASLKLFSSEIAKSLVENNSLVRVVSMAFLLLTVIILGAGNKLNPEGVGTLLGTVAGYIFGKNKE